MVFEIRKALIGLFDIDEILVRHPDEGPSSPCYIAVPLMSLPEIFGTTADTVPAQVPYLFAQPERIARWKKRIPVKSFRMGIAWAGRPEHTNDRNRS